MIDFLRVDTDILIMTCAFLMGTLMSLIHHGSSCFQERGMIIMVSYVFAGIAAIDAYHSEDVYLMLFGILGVSFACLTKETDAERNTTAALLTMVVIMMCTVVTTNMGKVLMLPCALFTFSALLSRVTGGYTKSRIAPPPQSRTLATPL